MSSVKCDIMSCAHNVRLVLCFIIERCGTIKSTKIKLFNHASSRAERRHNLKKHNLKEDKQAEKGHMLEQDTGWNRTQPKKENRESPDELELEI